MIKNKLHIHLTNDKNISVHSLNQIRWNEYHNILITGEDPLLHLDSVRRICFHALNNNNNNITVNTPNGSLLTRFTAMDLYTWGVKHVQIELIKDPKETIDLVQDMTFGSDLKIHFYYPEGIKIWTQVLKDDAQVYFNPESHDLASLPPIEMKKCA